MYKVMEKRIQADLFEKELNDMEQEGYTFVTITDGMRVYRKL